MIVVTLGYVAVIQGLIFTNVWLLLAIALCGENPEKQTLLGCIFLLGRDGTGMFSGRWWLLLFRHQPLHLLQDLLL